MASPSSDKATPPGPSSMPRLQAGPLEPWTIRERLCLASAVRHNGDQNWLTVSKSMRPFLDAHRPAERFAPKNAAMQYASLLEGVEPPKRVKRGDAPSRDSTAKETPEDIVVRKLTFQRIEELKRIVAAEKDKFTELKRQQEMLRKGLLDEKLPEMWAEVMAKKRAAEEADAAVKFANEEAAKAAQDAQLIRETTTTTSSESATASTSETLTESPVTSASSNVVASPLPPPASATATPATATATPAATCAAMLEAAVSEESKEVAPKGTAEANEDLEATSEKPEAPSEVLAPESMILVETMDTGVDLKQKSPAKKPSTPPNVSAKLTKDSDVKKAADCESSEEATKNAGVIEEKATAEAVDSSASEPNLPLADKKGEEEKAEEADGEKLDIATDLPGSEFLVVKEVLASSEKSDLPKADAETPNEQTTADSTSDETEIAMDDDKSATSSISKPSAPDQHPRQPAVDERVILPDAPESKEATEKTEAVNAPLLTEEEEGESVMAAPLAKISAGPEVTLEDIEKHRKSDKLASKKTSAAAATAVDDESGVVDGVDAVADTKEALSTSPAPKTTPDSALEGIEEPIEQRILEDSESEADAELEASSDVHDHKVPSIMSGATPSESETEDTFSNAASPRADGRGRLRHAGSDFGSSIAGPTSSCPNSPASISQSSDIEADEKAHRAWKKSIMLVWRNASHHKYANLFVNPVTDEIAPGYSVVIKRPIDLKTIKSKVDNGQISNTAEFQRDFMLMFTNAIMYNNSDQDIFAMTTEMYRDVLEDIEQFVSTQLMVQAALASSNASESASSPAVASSSRLRGRPSRAQKQQQQQESASAAASASTEEASTEAESRASGISTTPIPPSKRKQDETASKSKKRRSHRVD